MKKTIVLLLTALLLFGLWNMRPLVRSYHSLYELELARADNHANDVLSTLHASIVTLRIQEQETAAAIAFALHLHGQEGVAEKEPGYLTTESRPGRWADKSLTLRKYPTR